MAECIEILRVCLTYRDSWCMFVIDSHNEAIAIAEANRLKIPVIAW